MATLYDPTQSNLLYGGSLAGGAAPVLKPAVAAPAPAPIPAPAPKPAYVAPRPAAPVAAPTPAAPTAQPIQIAPEYAQYVETRPSPSNPGVLEYYNPENNMGFSSEQDVYNYLLTKTGKQFTNLGQLTASPTAPQAASSIDPYATLAQTAAQAGMSLDDFLKYITPGVTPDERNGIDTSLGIPDLYKQLFTPAPSTQELYNNAYSTAGLGDLKQQIAAKMKQLDDVQGQYTNKAGDVNENPWLSEASRTGRISRLDDKRTADVGNIQNEVNQLTDLYNNGINEVNSVVGRSTADFSNNQQINSMKLQYLQQQAEQKLQDLQSTKSASAYKYLPDYLKAKAAATAPDTIGGPDVGYFRWDASTGTYQQVIAPQDKSLDDQKKQLEIAKLQQDLAGGGNADELLSVGDAQTLGVPYGTTKGQAVAQGITTNKPATDAQNQAATYATRVQQAGTALDQVASKIVSMNPAEYEIEKRLPSYLQSADYQAYDQAAKNLINAVLRRESGAAIAQSEFDNAYAQYLPKPGDTAQTLAQKKQNRDTILNGLKQSAGPAAGGTTGLGSASDPLGLFSEKGGGLATVNQKFPDGTVGGQCGTFAHQIANFPPVGNMLSEKQAIVNKNGISAAEWRKEGAKPGDVIISNYGQYGHVEVVVAVQGDKVITKGSNFNEDQKVGTRTVSMSDGKIYGVLRGTLKL
jgi:CHAP domain